MKRETVLQNQIRCALSHYGVCIRLNTGVFKTANGDTIKQGIPGMPDLLFIGDHGKTVWLEVKTQTGKISEEQSRFITMLRERGHIAAIVRSVDEAVDLVKLAGEL